MRYNIVNCCLIVLFFVGFDAFIIPDELPSLLSVIYSNIPTIKKGKVVLKCKFNIFTRGCFRYWLPIGLGLQTGRQGWFSSTFRARTPNQHATPSKSGRLEHQQQEEHVGEPGQHFVRTTAEGEEGEVAAATIEGTTTKPRWGEAARQRGVHVAENMEQGHAEPEWGGRNQNVAAEPGESQTWFGRRRNRCQKCDPRRRVWWEETSQEKSRKG